MRSFFFILVHGTVYIIISQPEQTSGFCFHVHACIGYDTRLLQITWTNTFPLWAHKQSGFSGDGYFCAYVTVYRAGRNSLVMKTNLLDRCLRLLQH
jgi:hypothetical protein